jgi:hypothetical protein
MTETIFAHEKLDVYRLSIEYVAASYGLAKSLRGANRHIRDPWLRAAQSIPLNIAEGNGKQNLKDKPVLPDRSRIGFGMRGGSRYPDGIAVIDEQDLAD